ncbi:YtcA family lipoprotein [Klebsiella aerogenes]|uniref:YtcA family lipoprotein n=1 Tax=Klebsiella aerogenes TaxID=548 RepID=UPI00378F3902
MKIKLQTRVVLLPAAFFLPGCSFSPSLPFLGAAFPDWLYCIAGGAVITGLIFRLMKGRFREHRQCHTLEWLLMTTILSSVTWLILFS